MNVLVADDNEEIASIIMTYLEGELKVVGASDAVTALDLIESSKPQVIVADLNIPPLEGLEFIERINLIKEDWQYLIVLTGSAIGEASLEMLGVDSLYLKPCSMKNLTDLIKSKCANFQ